MFSLRSWFPPLLFPEFDYQIMYVYGDNFKPQSPSVNIVMTLSAQRQKIIRGIQSTRTLVNHMVRIKPVTVIAVSTVPSISTEDKVPQNRSHNLTDVATYVQPFFE